MRNRIGKLFRRKKEPKFIEIPIGRPRAFIEQGDIIFFQTPSNFIERAHFLAQENDSYYLRVITDDGFKDVVIKTGEVYIEVIERMNDEELSIPNVPSIVYTEEQEPQILQPEV